MKELTHGSAENTKFPPKVDTFRILQNYQSIFKYIETKVISKKLADPIWLIRQVMIIYVFRLEY